MKRLLLPSLAALAILCFVTVFVAPAHAAINSQISFQGKLTNTDGTNVSDGNYSVRFRIYTDPSLDGANSCLPGSNTCKWEETQGSVSVTGGLFHVNLGSSIALPASVDFNNSALYLGIKVSTDAEMTPRIRLTAAPYSFNSDLLDGLDSAALVQLSPGAQQSGNINVSGTITSGAHNGITIGSTIQPSVAGSLSIQSNGANALNLDSGGAAAINIGASNTNAINIGNTSGSTNLSFLVGSSTSAFDIQGPSSAVYLQLDSTNSRLYVGNPTADGTGFLLVLDSKNTSADPTGVNGSLYYNSADNDFRAYQNSRWTNIQPVRYAYLSADRASSSTTYADVTDLSFAVDANTNYEVVCNLIYQTAATTTGIGVALNGPTSPGIVAGQFVSNSSATALNGRSFNAYNGTGKTTGVPTANTNTYGIFRAYFRNGTTAGTLQLRYASEVASSAVTVKANSYCRISEL